jgi:hypothetical protein
MKKGTYPISSLVKTSHNKLEDPQNNKKEIEIFGTSKYQNKIPLKFPKENQIPYFSPMKLHAKKLNTPKMTRRKYENKILSKFT